MNNPLYLAAKAVLEQWDERTDDGGSARLDYSVIQPLLVACRNEEQQQKQQAERDAKFLEEQKAFEASLTPFDRWLEENTLDGLEELVWAARRVRDAWENGPLADAVTRLDAALEPFSTAPAPSEAETNKPA
jgi:hypothetical protein